MKVKLSDVSKEIFAGGDVPKERFSEHKTKEFFVPIYANAEKDNGLYGYTDKARVFEEAVTVAARGTIGFCAKRHEPFLPVVRLITVIPNKEKITTDYLFYALKNIKSGGNGTSIPQLTVPDIKQYTFNLVALEEQNKIVKQLMLLEKIINIKKAQLDRFNDLTKARFVEMFGEPIRNPKGWRKKPLAKLCNGIGDGLHGTPIYDDDGEYPFINGNNLINGKIVVTNATKFIGRTEYERLYIDICNNAVLVSINGTLGKLAYYNGEQIAIGKSVCYCNLEKGINKYFVYGLMQSNDFVDFMENSATKSTIKNVGLKAIREFEIITPPIELQEEFAAFAIQVDKSRFAIQKSLDEAQLLFDSLMQEYFG